jgi:hypothetical protein
VRGLKSVKRKGGDKIMARKMNDDAIAILAPCGVFFLLVTNFFLFGRCNQIKSKKYQ